MIRVNRGEIKNEAGYFGKGAEVELSREEEKRLIAAGRAEPVYPGDSLPGPEEDVPENPERMTVAELREYARRENIDLKGAAVKSAILEIIREADPRG